MKAIFIKDNYTVVISKELAERIKSADDLNNLFAFVEEDLTEDEWENTTYDFGEETERIKTFMNGLNYCSGHYNCDVIKRLFDNLD